MCLNDKLKKTLKFEVVVFDSFIKLLILEYKVLQVYFSIE